MKLVLVSAGAACEYISTLSTMNSPSSCQSINNVAEAFTIVLIVLMSMNWSYSWLSFSVLRYSSTMAGSNLPEFCLDYRKYTVEMISEPTAAIIKKVRKQMDDVASVPDDKVSDGRVR